LPGGAYSVQFSSLSLNRAPAGAVFAPEPQPNRNARTAEHSPIAPETPREHTSRPTKSQHQVTKDTQVKDERRETKDERRETKDERRKTTEDFTTNNTKNTKGREEVEAWRAGKGRGWMGMDGDIFIG